MYNRSVSYFRINLVARILYIDPCADLGALLGILLALDQHELRWCATAARAEPLIAQGWADGLVVDLHTPDLMLERLLLAWDRAEGGGPVVLTATDHIVSPPLPLLIKPFKLDSLFRLLELPAVLAR